jgi:hypothetical protein
MIIRQYKASMVYTFFIKLAKIAAILARLSYYHEIAIIF